MKFKLFATVGAATLLSAGLFSSAKPAEAALTGVLNITGDATFTSNSFSFSSTTGTPNTFNGAASSTGDFAGVTGGSIANITAPATGTGAPLDLPNFLTFNSPTVGTVSFDLLGFTQSDISTQSFPNGQSTVTVLAPGQFRDGGVTAGQGIFTAQITTGQTAGGPTTYSASFSTSAPAVPEPSDVAGIATVGILGATFVVGNRKRLGLVKS